MSNLVAIEWDAREARVVVGRQRGNGAVMEQAFAIPLESGGEETPVAPKKEIAAALKERGVARAETIVALGRSNVELRQLQLPPCPDDELPEMVRFQAMRQFTGVNEKWPLDYIPLHRLEDDESAHVLAAAINPSTLEPIREMCSESGVVLKRLVLRPFAASLLMKRAASDNQCRMLVDMLSDAADLTVLVGDDVVFVRTVRLPASNVAAVRANALLGEIRRTIPAARNQAGGREVEVVTLCGDHSELGQLEEIVRSKLDLTVDHLDPFSEVEVGGDLASRRPENSGRYAALLGAMNTYGASGPRGIDFLNPRKRPKPKSNRNRYAFAGAMAVIIALVIGFIGWFELNRLGSRYTTLKAEFDKQEPNAKRMRKRVADLLAVRTHLEDHDIVWLDELKDITDRLPDSNLALISNMSMSADPKMKGGKLTVKGYVSDSSMVEKMRALLDDGERRMVDAGPVLADRQYKEFPYRISEAFYIRPHAEGADSGPSNLPPGDETEPSKDDKNAKDESGDTAAEDAAAQPADDSAAKDDDAKPTDDSPAKDDDAKPEDAKPEDAKPEAGEPSAADLETAKPEEDQPATDADKPADGEAKEETTEGEAAAQPPEEGAAEADKPADAKEEASEEAKEESADDKPTESKTPEDAKKANADLTSVERGSLQTASTEAQGDVQ